MQNQKSFPALIEQSKKISTDFAALRYAALAVSKDPNREVLSRVLIHKGHAIGIDGRRLHIARLVGDNFPQSDEQIAYRVVKLTKTLLIFQKVEDAGNYPNYRQVIPKELSNSLGTYHLSGVTTLSGIFCGILNAANETAFNFDFFKDLVPSGSFEAFQADDCSPLCLVESNGGVEMFKGVLMPIRCS
jgi:hypothetical protein